MHIGIIAQHRSGHTAYEQQLSQELNLKTIAELDENIKNPTLFLNSIPNDCIFSMMISPDTAEILKNYKEINWRILYRRDVYTQMLSFIYTNAVQEFRKKCENKVKVNLSNIDFFVSRNNLIRSLIAENQYPVYYYEDLGLMRAFYQPTNNNYQDLIVNLDEVRDYFLNLS